MKQNPGTLPLVRVCVCVSVCNSFSQSAFHTSIVLRRSESITNESMNRRTNRSGIGEKTRIQGRRHLTLQMPPTHSGQGRMLTRADKVILPPLSQPKGEGC